MTGKRLKDFYRFVRSVESFTNQQAKVLDWDEAALSEVKVQIQPNDGPYEGGRFVFLISLPEEFPDCKPDVYCETEVYHPNIDPTSDSENVCLNLFDEWTSNFGLRDVIQGLLFLFYNPNLEDPLSTYFGDPLDETDFENNVRASLRGEDVEGYEFPYNYFGIKEDMKVTPHIDETGKINDDTKMTKDTTDKVIPKDLTTDEGDRENVNDRNVPNVQDINLILEKVSELMMKHPEDEDQNSPGDGDVEEGDNTGTSEIDNKLDSESVTQNHVNTVISENSVTADRTVVGSMVEIQTDLVNNENSATDVRPGCITENKVDLGSAAQDQAQLVTSDNSTQQCSNVFIVDSAGTIYCDNSNNIDIPVECDTDTGSEGSRSRNIEDISLQRQSSKLDRQCSRSSLETSALNFDIEEDMENFDNCLQRFRTCSFVAPDFDHAINILGAVCYYIYKTYIT